MRGPRGRHRNCFVGALAALVALGAAPAGATPPTPHAFSQSSARPGDHVTVSIGGYPPAPSLTAVTRRSTVRVYLIPMRKSPRWWTSYTGSGFSYGAPPKIAGAVALGRLTIVNTIAGHLRIVVPRVRAGLYVLGYWATPSNARWSSARPDVQLGTKSILRVKG